MRLRMILLLLSFSFSLQATIIKNNTERVTIKLKSFEGHGKGGEFFIMEPSKIMLNPGESVDLEKLGINYHIDAVRADYQGKDKCDHIERKNMSELIFTDADDGSVNYRATSPGYDNEV